MDDSDDARAIARRASTNLLSEIRRLLVAEVARVQPPRGGCTEMSSHPVSGKSARPLPPPQFPSLPSHVRALRGRLYRDPDNTTNGECARVPSDTDGGGGEGGSGVSAATEFGIPAGPPNCYGPRTHGGGGLIIKIKYCGDDGELALPSFIRRRRGAGWGGVRRDAATGSSRALLFSPTGGNIHN